MRYEEILAALRKNREKFRWIFVTTEDGRRLIRSESSASSEYGDPLTAVYGAAGTEGMYRWMWIANALHLSPELARSLVQAADDLPGMNPKIRQDFLEATGLLETAELLGAVDLEEARL